MKIRTVLIAALITVLMTLMVLYGPFGSKKTEEGKTPEGPVAMAPRAPGAAPGKEELAATQAPTGELAAIPGQPPVAGVPAGPAAMDIITAARFNSDRIENGAPAGWELDKKSGTPAVTIDCEGNTCSLHLTSDGESSFGVKKGVSINIREYPVLNWRWKAITLPSNGDVRKKHTDDQALQIYVAFPATGWPEKLNTPVIGYIWDSEAPKGWTGRSPHLGGDKLRYVVVRNKTDQTGEWFTEKRNIYQDYQRLFRDLKGGQPLGPTKGISLYINSQHTGSPAEGCIAEIFFSRS